MKLNDSKYLWFVGEATIGILCCVMGLGLASLSDPRRYSLSASDDQYIYGYLLAGLVLTLAGVGLFLYAVKGTTAQMTPELRKQVNTGIGIGYALQCAGLLAATQWPDNLGTALTLMVPGVATFTWGTMKYALGKGYAQAYGLLGLLGVVGLVILILLPERTAGQTTD